MVQKVLELLHAKKVLGTSSMGRELCSGSLTGACACLSLRKRDSKKEEVQEKEIERDMSIRDCFGMGG
uniref:T5H22.1 protein n=1 Tax=Arabidopsis thaliana TaxID=3702 RepID=O82609_ARATH|nr:T5H22.1 gene product [Arabidopsis thaliana]